MGKRGADRQLGVGDAAADSESVSPERAHDHGATLLQGPTPGSHKSLRGGHPHAGEAAGAEPSSSSSSSCSPAPSAPHEFLRSPTWSEFAAHFGSCHAVVFRSERRGRGRGRARGDDSAVGALARVFADGSEALRSTWCVENGPKDASSRGFFDESLDPCYCSFIAKGEADVASVLEQLPVSTLPLQGAGGKERYSDALWVFLGRSSDELRPLTGRKLHTDDVPHDGTLHYQWTGSKRWFLKPTGDLLSLCPTLEDKEHSILCEPGDVIVVNTRLWWHRTELPCTRSACGGASVSVARDLFLWDSARSTEADFCNVDGFYAANPIEAGTVVVLEKDMPDIELPSSADPNCSVEEIQEGVFALVAQRAISTGEWFSVAQDSSSEEDSDGDENESEH